MEETGRMEELYRSVIALIDGRMGEKQPLVVAIEGRCASGKTTLAEALRRHYGCQVIHMDHFFLRPQQRTPERLARPGENIDHERFLEEVLTPLGDGKEFSYRPFDCSCQALAAPVTIEPGDLTIIEGAYACHSELWDRYDLRIFLTVPPEEQMVRILRRNGEGMARIFRDRWIPMEEAYFEAFRVADRCDACFGTGTYLDN